MPILCMMPKRRNENIKLKRVVQRYFQPILFAAVTQGGFKCNGGKI